MFSIVFALQFNFYVKRFTHRKKKANNSILIRNIVQIGK